jgi:hypothetical protein
MVLKMRTVQEVYDQYRIPPWLQLHQLRVAAVGKMVCDSRGDADERTVLLTGLFHDMGNIIKADLTLFPQLFPNEEVLVYWQSVKEDFLRTYGTNEHEATHVIGREILLPENVLQTMDGISFSKIENTLNNGPRELQISQYADMRVGFFGVLPIAERATELKKRARLRWSPETAREREEIFDKSIVFLAQIEEVLFGSISLRPHDITDERIAPLLDDLRSFEF